MSAKNEEKRKRKKLRVIAGPSVVPQPTRVATRTRLVPTAADEVVLRAVGAEMSRCEGWALRRRVAHGPNFTKAERAALKRDLTALGLTARQAGSVVTRVMALWRGRRKAQLRELQSLAQRIKTIKHKLELVPGARGAYRSPKICFEKSRKLAALRARQRALREEYRSGHVRVTRGGHALLKKRHNLDDANMTAAPWRQQWEAKRFAFAFSGEGGKLGGNETLRVNADGRVELRLPNTLADLANAPGSRYVFASPVKFTHRAAELAQNNVARAAIAYRVYYDPTRQRWYVDATIRPAPAIPLEDTGRVVGVDVNADHLAVWTADAHGNPVGRPLRIPLELKGLSASTRDARVRSALTKIIAYARKMRASKVAIEGLGFADDLADSKETKPKHFRAAVHGMPTAKLRSRGAAMLTRAGLAVVAVDPAYTSVWGRAWTKPLNVSGHAAAAFLIALRANKRYGRRRDEPARKQSIACSHSSAQVAPGTRGADPIPKGSGSAAAPQGRKAARSDTHTGAGSTREQDRSVPGDVSMSPKDTF